jgi:hypothetical protein
MNKPFIYDEKTSSLYSPNGDFLKTIFCPKSASWNQLIVDDAYDRSRGCNQCSERIINLDACSIDEALSILKTNRNTCVYASKNSQNVIFLVDKQNPNLPHKRVVSFFERNSPPLDLPTIRTVRNLEDIERARRMGFWPDVRLVRYKDKEITQKFALYQNSVTGEIKRIGDYRSTMSSSMDKDLAKGQWQEVIPFTHYYSGYQEEPIAAYLIPKELADGADVFVPDPIEDMVGATWNQGDSYRANNLTGKVMGKKVVLNPASIERADFMG